MPRSRSMSFESITRSVMRSCAAEVPACCRSLSTSVVLPWWTGAMMAILGGGRAAVRGVVGGGWGGHGVVADRALPEADDGEDATGGVRFEGRDRVADGHRMAKTHGQDTGPRQRGVRAGQHSFGFYQGVREQTGAVGKADPVQPCGEGALGERDRVGLASWPRNVHEQR